MAHLKTRAARRSSVPVGWIVVGDPARILPPDQRDAIREIKKPLNLPLAVYGRAR